uniref:HEAT repeat-containing protein 1 n=1 Tax=Heterorhabditis bacteriophora TaxID=37862 RepID=A0A1I7WTG4_HETBA
MPPYQRSSGASSVENMDPNFLFQIDGKVTALINNMRHPDCNIRRKTINSVQDMAKRKEFALVNQVRLRELLGQFLQFVYEHNVEQNHTQLLQSIFNIINCRNCISVLMDQQMQHILFNIVYKYLNPDRPYTAWIVIVFTALLQKQQLTKFRRWMRKNDYFVNRLMLILHSQSEFNKSLAIDSIRMLVYRTTALKESFVRGGGMALLLNFLQTENEEKVLFSSTKNLLTLISTESSDFGRMFVMSSGVQILGNLLSHGSSRLLHVVLQCMSSVGDLKDLASQV